MESLNNLPLAKLAVLERWTMAKQGALLQVRINGRVRIGMRTSGHFANAERDAFVILGGDDAGHMLTEGVQGGALELGSHVVLVAKNPTPFEAMNHQLPRGALLRYKEQDVYFAWVQVDGGNATGAVCIQSTDASCPVGTCYVKLTKAVIPVAEKVDVATTPELHAFIKSLDAV